MPDAVERLVRIAASPHSQASAQMLNDIPYRRALTGALTDPDGCQATP
jgi:hypothetical protein